MNKKVAFYLLGYKGYKVLTDFLNVFSPKQIAYVVVGVDKGVENDYSSEIFNLCSTNGVVSLKKDDVSLKNAELIIAIGWRWLISNDEAILIVLHDSLLPRLRGFNPLVTALINGDKEIGVTALFASKEYDCGDIIKQKNVNITYPIKISKAIELIAPLYSDLIYEICSDYFGGKYIASQVQDNSKATYSIWRDNEDYLIDWAKSSEYICRFIDAVGYPYLGALTTFDDKTVVVLEAEVVEDVVVENRANGKVIFVEDGCPIVICGNGLLKITNMIEHLSKQNLIPMKKFRTRFR